MLIQIESLILQKLFDVIAARATIATLPTSLQTEFAAIESKVLADAQSAYAEAQKVVQTVETDIKQGEESVVQKVESFFAPPASESPS